MEPMRAGHQARAARQGRAARLEQMEQACQGAVELLERVDSVVAQAQAGLREPPEPQEQVVLTGLLELLGILAHPELAERMGQMLRELQGLQARVENLALAAPAGQEPQVLAALQVNQEQAAQAERTVLMLQALREQAAQAEQMVQAALRALLELQALLEPQEQPEPAGRMEHQGLLAQVELVRAWHSTQLQILTIPLMAQLQTHLMLVKLLPSWTLSTLEQMASGIRQMQMLLPRRQDSSG